MSDVSDATLKFEAVKIALTQDKNGYVIKLSVHPADVPDELFRAWVGARYMVVMVQLDSEDQPIATQAAVEGKKAIQQAGILCHDPKFMQWLGLELGELIMDEPTCAEELRKYLQIMSRAELTDSAKARKAFNALRDKFNMEIGNAPASD